MLNMKNLDLVKLKKIGLAMIKFFLLFLVWFTFALNAEAAGSIIASAVFAGVLSATTISVIAFAINIVLSSIIAKAFAPDSPQSGSQDSQPNPGSRQQLPPAGDNKLPIVYGSAFVGGVIVDMSITANNQDIYWVMALSEVTNTENGGTGDNFTFGKIYWGGKLVIFSNVAGQRFKVTGLQDESNGEIQNVSGKMDIFTYSNGSNSPLNSSLSAIQVMNSAGLIYTWDSTKLMTNTAFVIIHIRYSQSRNLTGLSQTRFQLINPRDNPADCIFDYFTSTRYGAAIAPALMDTVSLDALSVYSDEIINYTLFSGGSANQKRFTFNGTLETNAKIMQNIQNMADCCDCLIKYAEITGLWGVIVQKPNNTIAMNINDSNIVSSITISPSDLSNSFNIIEVKFPDGSAKDSFNSASFDLAIINPSLMFPNEPVNKQSLSLYLVNNSVQAQYLANRMLESAREDLTVQLEIDYTGLQLEAGDIVAVTNTNYGWNAKQYRISKVVEKFSESGQVTADLNLIEFNGAVYDDRNVTQFTPSPNTGIGSPTAFGIVPAPTVSTVLPNAANPAFSIIVTTSSSGITQFAEIWYSAFQFPSDTQRIFAGTTAIKASGDPYDPSTAIQAVQLFNIQQGNYYFFSRMVNSLASSNFSPASALFRWRPTTFQFSERYVSVAYANDIIGTGFSLSPRNKTYYGLFNTSSASASTNPSNYQWILAEPAFGTNIFLVYINFQNRRFGFDTDFSTFAAGSGAFVPSTGAQFDQRLWSALQDGLNIIDLDKATGQVTQTGTTTTGTGQVKITNTSSGQLIASLDQFLNFGGPTTLTGSATTLTIDIYGRVVGFTTPDSFFFSSQSFTATSGQTLFTPSSRVAGYIAGQELIFQNGALLDESDYVETTTTFTLNVGATLDDFIEVISMRAVSSTIFYENLSLIVESTSANTAVWDSAQMPYQLFVIGDKITFSNVGSPTQYTITAINYVTRTLTFSTNPIASFGDTLFRYRANGESYPAFSRWSFDLVNSSSYTPTEWAVQSGYELLFLNGTVSNEQDYDIVDGAITNFPSTTNGKMTMIQFGQNNLTTPIGFPSNVVNFTSSGIATYSYTYNPNAFNLYANGVIYKDTVDYSTGTNSYTISPTPTDSITALLQQSYLSQGAA